jgi:hypothetical protein
MKNNNNNNNNDNHEQPGNQPARIITVIPRRSRDDKNPGSSDPFQHRVVDTLPADYLGADVLYRYPAQKGDFV